MLSIKPICQIVNECATRAAAKEQEGYLQAARNITRAIATNQSKSYPPTASRFLCLASEVALCTLIADRSPEANQPALKFLLRELRLEVIKLLKSTSQQTSSVASHARYLGVINYANSTLSN